MPKNRTCMHGQKGHEGQNGHPVHTYLKHPWYFVIVEERKDLRAKQMAPDGGRPAGEADDLIVSTSRRYTGQFAPTLKVGTLLADDSGASFVLVADSVVKAMGARLWAGFQAEFAG